MKIADLPIPEELKDVLNVSGYSELYPPQEEAIKSGVLEGKNLVLASPTASGKTLVAELCVMKKVLEGGGKALYLIPLRALASEKFEDFRKYEGMKKAGGRVKVSISTGDYDGSDPWLARSDVIICTNEKLDSLTRHRAPWLEEISTVVADEVHLLTELGRGPTLEVVLTRLMQTVPNAQVLALSATVRNATELAEWLKATAITTDWRPVPLREGVYCSGQVQFKDGSARFLAEDLGSPVLSIASDVIKGDGQILVFTETRRAAVDMAKKLSSITRKLSSQQERRSLEAVANKVLNAGERTSLSEVLAHIVHSGSAFHHAGLAHPHRRAIEDAFREGKIKALSATPTLAAGVNLPARTVVISSYKRYEPGYGRYDISVLEYKQFCGRAGRPKYDSYGESILLAQTEDERESLMENYVLSQPERLWSKLGVEAVLRPHVLSTIASGFAHSEDGLHEFFARTLYAHQYGPKSIKSKLGQILKYLVREELIEVRGRQLSPTKFGRRVSELYIDPVSAVIFRDGLYRGAKLMTELSLLHLIAHTPDIAPRIYPRRNEADDLSALAESAVEELMVEPPTYYGDPTAYEEFLAELKCAKVLLEWISEVPEDEILEKQRVEPGDLLRLTEISDWLLYAVHELAKLLGVKGIPTRAQQLRLRVQTGVKGELVPLVQLKGVGRVRARAIYNAGYRTVGELKSASVTDLMRIPTIGPGVAKRIKEQVGGLIKKEEWEMLKGHPEELEQTFLTEY